MQYLDDDMDEVFRRAAEDYPLNTDSADWNEVLKKLSSDDAEKTTVVTPNKKNYKPLLLLLLLLPVTWIGYEYFRPNNYDLRNSIADKHVSKNIASSKQSSTTQLNKTRSENINLPQTVTPAALQASPVNNHALYQGNKNYIYKQKGRTRSIQSAPQATQINNIVPDQASVLENVIKKEDARVIVNNENGKKKTAIENISTKQDSDKKENNTTTVIEKTKNQKPTKQHGMYAGIYFSPDISTVKFQSVKGTGHTIGLLIGYQFNKKLSLETGLAWNKKHYYSNGDYFNTKNIVLPAYAKITQLDGVCKMIEVPVTVRYNFRSSVKTNLSVSGGVSSYIMKSESYDYTIDHTGLQYPRSADYKNSSTNLFAVANIGFGYNRSLGKGTALRLEPYIKIPLTGVGIGKLPIMSTGMNIGITKKLSK